MKADLGPAFVIEPIAPVTPGHLLVIPHQHVRDALDNPQVTGEVMAAAARFAKDSGIPRLNLITSVGRDATQTVFQLHVHVVPRRPDDDLILPWSEPRHRPGGSASR